MRKKLRALSKYNEGQILAEILLAVAIIAIIATVVAQLTVTSTRLSGSASNRLVEVRLAEEAMEALRAISQGNNASSQGWNRLYRPPDGTGDPSSSKGEANPYHPEQSGGIWVLVPGEETLTISGKTYQRKILINNVSREVSGAIELTYNAANDDPATQKITASVAAPSSPRVSFSSFFTRYLNEGSKQTDWSGGVNAGPFGATSPVTTISSSQNADLGGASCGGAGPCVRLQSQ